MICSPVPQTCPEPSKYCYSPAALMSSIQFAGAKERGHVEGGRRDVIYCVLGRAFAPQMFSPSSLRRWLENRCFLPLSEM